MKFKKTDMVYCPVCKGAGIINQTTDELGIISELCPHGRYITYPHFLEIKLPKEKAKLYPKHLITN